MVEINYKIVICGIIALTVIQMTMVLSGNSNDIITTTIIGAIGLAIGILIPIPKIDNSRGVLKW